MPRTPSSRPASVVGDSAHRPPAGACKAWRLFVIGLGMLVSGVAFKATMIGNFPILSVFGFIVMFGGVVFAVTGSADVRPGGTSPDRPPGAPRQRRTKGGGGSFTSRMEDRFRRRFDE